MLWRRSADASGHQSTTCTAPSRPGVEIGALAGREVPDPGLLVALALVLEREPLVARDGRPALRRAATCPRRAGRRPSRPCAGRRRAAPGARGRRARRARGRAACRPPRARRAGSRPRSTPPSVDRLRGAVELARGRSVERDVDREPVAVADPDRRRSPGAWARPSFQPCGTPSRNGRVSPPCERLDEPAAGLVPGLVLEPEHALAVERRRSVEEADRMIRHLAPLARSRDPRRAPARRPTRSTRTRAGRERLATTRAGRSPARGSAAPRSPSRPWPRRRRLTPAGRLGSASCSSRATGRCSRVPTRRVSSRRRSATSRSGPTVSTSSSARRSSRSRRRSQASAQTEIRVFAQNVHWELEGAFTGEVSAPMLLELGVQGTLVGHSERRQHFGETDETVRLRAEAALEAGLDVIACVGETAEEREAGETQHVLERQVSVLPVHERLVIAYEPVWAIGTGLTATPDLAQEAHAFVKSLHDAPVLYGGSVKPENAAHAARAAGRRRRARRRCLARRARLRGDLPGGSRRRRRVSVPLCALVILDGWGIAPPGPGNAVELAEHARLRRALGALSARAARGVRRRRRAARGSDGELRGRSPHDRVRPRCSSRTSCA